GGCWAGPPGVARPGWRDSAVAGAGALRKIPAAPAPPTLALHAVGGTGFTAYFGLLEVGRPKPGDTVVVSGAAGAVGQIVGQLAKLAGCQAVGISGGPGKMRDLPGLYGDDAAADYKNDDLRAPLKAACARR